jgi:lysophospholipase L1-like esterase
MGVPLARAAGALAGGWAVARLAWFGARARRARRLARSAIPYERIGAEDRALLVIGDSLAVGVGARDPAHSVAGRIAGACPGLTVVNRARSGARIADVPLQIEAAPRRRYDAVLLAVGGNDAFRLTTRQALVRDALPAIDAARRLAPRVVVATSANLGSVPIVPWPLTRLLERRSRIVRDVLRGASRGDDVHFVDFHRPRATDPFRRSPDLYFGDDGVHPSSVCYALCFEVIARRTGLVAALSGAPRAKKRPA